MATAILGAAAWLIVLWHRIGEKVTPDDLTAAEKFLSYSLPGREYDLLLILLCLFAVAVWVGTRRR